MFGSQKFLKSIGENAQEAALRSKINLNREQAALKLQANLERWKTPQ